jgi:predicted transcriptional regulator
MLDRDLPMGSRDIATFARTGHETVRRAADALYQLGLIDRHRRPLLRVRTGTDETVA